MSILRIMTLAMVSVLALSCDSSLSPTEPEWENPVVTCGQAGPPCGGPGVEIPERRGPREPREP